MTGTLRGLYLHLDPTSGIAGDMAVAALVDAGVPTGVVSQAVASMGVKGLRTSFERRVRGAYVGRGFVVSFPGAPRRRKAKGVDQHAHADAHPHAHDRGHGHGHDHDLGDGHVHRDYADIRRLLKRASLDPDARLLAGEIFARVAEVEAKLHGMSVADVTFHEVGAYDSIADIVAISAAIVWLAPSAIGSSPPVVGTGKVHIGHGVVPVPAPATAALLRGIPMIAEGAGELTTPTGAAILATVVDSFGPPPPMVIRAVGYGAGTRELSDRPNVLRAMLGEPIGQRDEAPSPSIVLVEANIDDMSPELIAPLYDALGAAGAVDVWSTSILMKKGRPALQLAALVPAAAVTTVERAFFMNSTTLGLRVRAVDRVVLARSFATVDTRYGRIRVKLAALEGEVIGAHPEFVDCQRLASKARVPVRAVMSAAVAEAQRFIDAGRPPGRRRRP